MDVITLTGIIFTTMALTGILVRVLLKRRRKT